MTISSICPFHLLRAFYQLICPLFQLFYTKEEASLLFIRIDYALLTLRVQTESQSFIKEYMNQSMRKRHLSRMRTVVPETRMRS